MIKFFRKIRQKLLQENRVSKYLLYAFGEIILVVIGILIALGINNWNETRKNNKEEKIVLNNIYENLEIDFKKFKYYEKQFKQIDNLHTELYRYGFKNEVSVILSEPALMRRTLYFAHLIDSNFKENIYTINNLKVKEALVSYTKSIADMEDAYWIELAPLINERLKPYLSEQEIYNTQNWFELKKRTFDDYNFEEINGKKIINEEKFLELVKTDKFQQILFEVNLKWNEFYGRVKTVIEENNNLKNLIKLELENY